MFSAFLDIIAPKRCVICKEYGNLFCEDCVKKIYKREPYCYICKKSSSRFFLHPNCKKDNKKFVGVRQIVVFGHYNGSILKKIIQHAKFYRKKALLENISDFLFQILVQNVELSKKEKYVLVSPPIYFLRRWKRGYNHSMILSKFLSEKTGIIDISLFIKKIKHTKQQSKLQQHERTMNLKWAYKIHAKAFSLVKGKTCIIVDDVISTGSTLIEMKNLLMESWARDVIGLMVASD